MEDEGCLKAHYDVIICGTGLVESIVSCAASRCGLEVLHLDRNDYYGSNFASFNLERFLALNNCHRQVQGSGDYSNSDNLEQPVVEGANCLVSEDLKPFLGLTRVITWRPQCLPVSSPQGSPEGTSAVNENHDVMESKLAEEDGCAELESLIKQSRRFCLDLNCKFLFAAGVSVDYFIKSGVANYLEFKSIDGITYVDKREVFAVPSSKSDMFNSRFFNPLEKRLMTKFIMFVSDYGRTAAGTDVKTLNERHLAQGRSLHRPQNKEATVHGYDVDSYINKPFIEFLTHCKITPRLQTIIIHALCFHVRNYVSRDSSADCNLDTLTALQLLSTHLTATGRYGDTALLWPIYGSSEMPQAFCRMSAVWGAIFLLRTFVTAVKTLDLRPLPWNNTTRFRQAELGREDEREDEPEVEQEVVQKNRTVAEKESSCLDFGEVAAKNDNVAADSLLQVTLSDGKSFTCNAFITNCDDYGDISVSDVVETFPKGCFAVKAALVTAIMVCSVSDSDSDKLPFVHDRIIEILPPMTEDIGNPHALYIIQSDATCQVCADGTAILHAVTQIDVPPNVCTGADVGSGFLLWDEFVDQMSQSIAEMVNRSICFLSSIHKMKVVVQKTFVRPLFDNSVSRTVNPVNQENKRCGNVVIVGESYKHFHLSTDDAIAQASEIFHRILPGREFMHQAELDPDFRNGMSGTGFSNPLEDMDDEMEYLAKTLSSTTASSAADNSGSESLLGETISVQQLPAELLSAEAVLPPSAEKAPDDACSEN
jgi:RAB protein geranylgeranyltransferase component A